MIVTAQTWLQLRCRLNDIARMGFGLKDFHVYDERNCTGFSSGTEIWTYWTTGMTHWRQWERLGPDLRPKHTIVFELDDTWYMMPIKVLKEDVLECPNLMRSEMARRLRVPLEELRCVRTDDPVDPMINHMVVPHSVWRITFEAYDWTWPITIQVQVGEASYPRQIMRRQTLQKLEKQLEDIPSRDEETMWIAPDGTRITAEIALYSWSNDDILKVVHCPGGVIPIWMQFRHTTSRRNDVPIHLAERVARDWVIQTNIIPRNVLRAKVRYHPNNYLEVSIMEIEHSSEQYDNVPLVYVWLRGNDDRRMQYKAQRTIDLIQQIAFDQDREQTGVLRWCTKVLQPTDPLPAEAHLVMFDQRGMQMLQGIRVCSRKGFWRVHEAEANNWLQGYRY
jgi:hypothetical protein